MHDEKSKAFGSAGDLRKVTNDSLSICIGPWRTSRKETNLIPTLPITIERVSLRPYRSVIVN